MKLIAVNKFPSHLGLAVVVALGLVGTGCQQHKQLDQAAHVAADGDQTATSLSNYYQKLGNATVTFERQYKVRFNQTDVPEALQKQFNLTERELQQRQALAAKFDALYITFGKIANNKPDDVQTAVGGLEKAVNGIDKNALTIGFPGFNGGNVTVPDQDVKDAIKGILGGILDLKKVKDVKKGNTALTEIATGVHALFNKEKPIYVALSKFYIDQSYAQLTTLIKVGLATPTDAIESSVPPFKIRASPVPTTDDAKNNAQFYANIDQVEFKESAVTEADSIDGALQSLVTEHQQLTSTLGS